MHSILRPSNNSSHVMITDNALLSHIEELLNTFSSYCTYMADLTPSSVQRRDIVELMVAASEKQLYRTESENDPTEDEVVDMIIDNCQTIFADPLNDDTLSLFISVVNDGAYHIMRMREDLHIDLATCNMVNYQSYCFITLQMD